MTKNSILTAKLCKVRSPVDKSSDDNSSPVWTWDPRVWCSVVLCWEHCVATDRNIRLSEMLIGTHSTCHRTRPTIAGNLHQNVENKSQARYLHCAHKPGFNNNILGQNYSQINITKGCRIVDQQLVENWYHVMGPGANINVLLSNVLMQSPSPPASIAIYLLSTFPSNSQLSILVSSISGSCRRNLLEFEVLTTG